MSDRKASDPPDAAVRFRRIAEGNGGYKDGKVVGSRTLVFLKGDETLGERPPRRGGRLPLAAVPYIVCVVGEILNLQAQREPISRAALMWVTIDVQSSILKLVRL